MALLAVLALALAAGAGYAGGRWATRDRLATRAGTAAPATTTTPVSAPPGPVSGTAVEPVEAVARAVGPAVVQVQTPDGLGSGFIYDASGLLLTAAHVTGGVATVQVRLADGRSFTGRVLGEDQATDVAVVRIPAQRLPLATLGVGAPVQVGQMAVAIGSPFGLDQTVTSGIVSAVGRPVQTPGGAIPMIQTDAPINPGNSGGALVDRKGRVIGLNDAIANAGSGGNVGVGFAVPIDTAAQVAKDLVAGRQPVNAYLGVTPADTSGGGAGALVVDVAPGSPAATAGLKRGDVVTAVDGRTINGAVDLVATIRGRRPGETVELRLADGRTLTATLAKSPTR
ncbi:MAG: trypsin-like peptidase domain-containing protein [Actinobacteria bacterium]|nr:trypsin-like peptidase domain-containing protein [Actinomycetota bacterium]